MLPIIFMMLFSFVTLHLLTTIFKNAKKARND